jgi:hypothetical protein
MLVANGLNLEAKAAAFADAVASGTR